MDERQTKECRSRLPRSSRCQTGASAAFPASSKDSSATAWNPARVIPSPDGRFSRHVIIQSRVAGGHYTPDNLRK